MTKRKARLTAFNQVNILETANRLFLEKGIEATTMDEIAKAANYSKTTIYVYFKSKEDIFNHLIFEGMVFLQTRLHEIAAQNGSFSDFYYDFCELLVSMHDNNQVYFTGITGKILCSEGDTLQDEILEKIYLSGEAINTIVKERLQQAIALGEVKADGELQGKMMVFWFCLLGIIEKGASKEDYVRRNLGKSRDEFFSFAFRVLLQSLLQQENI